MQTDAQKSLYRKLKQVAELIFTSRNNELKGWLTKIEQLTIRYLRTQDEPRIWQSKNWFGHSWWNVYLPKTGQTVRLASKEEARIWLEENLRF